MALVESLLTAIVKSDGDALVLHVGERPYVVAASGQVELSSRALTFEAMSGMLGQLLGAEAEKTLEELGAVEHQLEPLPVAAGEVFTVVAARGGSDIWIEIRRQRKVKPAPAPPPVEDVEIESAPPPAQVATPEPEAEPEAEPEPAQISAHEPEPEPESEPAVAPAMPAEEPMPESSPAPIAARDRDLDLDGPSEPRLARRRKTDHVPHVQADIPPITMVPVPPSRIETPQLEQDEPEMVIEMPSSGMRTSQLEQDEPEMAIELSSSPIETPQLLDDEPDDEPETAIELPSSRFETPQFAEDEPEMEPEMAIALPPSRMQTPQFARVEPERAPAQPPMRAQAPRLVRDEPQSAVILPLSRNHARGDQAARATTLPKAGLDRLLRIAAARGASALYLVSGAQPSIRTDGEISALGGEAALEPSEVEAMMIDIMPERNREGLQSGVSTEWICDVPDVGRIRCMSFRDHRGAGGIFRMIPARAISAEQLGLSREIQGLCAEAEGLVLVTGPRSSGKSTLIAAFVDLINRSRSDHVITLESQIKFVHENRQSLVSQREARGDNDELAAVARAALRENPDVLVIEDLRTPEVMNVALEAAESGHLVIGSVCAHTTTEAIDRIIDQTPTERRPKIQLALAKSLRGIVGQVLVRKSGGGRLAAREVLLNTSPVENLIAEGRTSDLPLAIDSGRRHGMVPLNDALVAFVQSGVVDAREAYRQAADRQGFLSLLKREGVDTSFVERLA